MTLASDLEPYLHMIVAARALRRNATSRRRRLRELTTSCRQEVSRSSELCNQAMFLGLDCVEQHKRYRFYLSAIADSERAFAMWPAFRLVASPRLLERAKIVVALGEEFHVDEGGCSVVAGLDEPLAAALTLLRACDQVLEFHVRFGDDLEINFASRISATGKG